MKCHVLAILAMICACNLTVVQAAKKRGMTDERRAEIQAGLPALYEGVIAEKIQWLTEQGEENPEE